MKLITMFATALLAAVAQAATIPKAEVEDLSTRGTGPKEKPCSKNLLANCGLGESIQGT